jgi:hypothetical protein
MGIYARYALIARRDHDFMACVSSEDGKPLMPAKRRGKVKRLLKDGRAEVAKLEASAI